jgi:hypothetical protein
MNERKVLTVSCSLDWYAWVKKAANKQRVTMARLIDLALAEYAEANEMELPPCRFESSTSGE